jgi:hypothetical protein
VNRELEMEDLKRRKDEAVRKRVPEEWLTRSKLEGVNEEEELIVAPRITEADKANDVRYLLHHGMGLSHRVSRSRRVSIFDPWLLCPGACIIFS